MRKPAKGELCFRCFLSRSPFTDQTWMCRREALLCQAERLLAKDMENKVRSDTLWPWQQRHGLQRWSLEREHSRSHDFFKQELRNQLRTAGKDANRIHVWSQSYLDRESFLASPSANAWKTQICVECEMEKKDMVHAFDISSERSSVCIRLRDCSCTKPSGSFVGFAHSHAREPHVLSLGSQSALCVISQHLIDLMPVLLREGAVDLN